MAACRVRIHSGSTTSESVAFELHEGDPASVICEKVATHLNNSHGLNTSQQIEASQVSLKVHGVPAGLLQPLGIEDRSNVEAHVFLDGKWLDIVYSWIDNVFSDDGMTACKQQLVEFVWVLSVRQLAGTGRRWGDAGEFGEIVKLLDEMLLSEETASESPSLSVVGVLRAAAGAEGASPSSALEVVGQQVQLQRHNELRRVEVLENEVRNGCQVLVHTGGGRTVSSCCEQVARSLPGVDPSQVELSTGGVSLRHLEHPQQGCALQASVSHDTWRDLVLRWRMERPALSTLASFIEELSQRPMPGTADYTWATTGEFGELVRSIDSLLQTEQRRGIGSNYDESEEVLEVVKDGVKDPMATPGSIKKLFVEEFG